MMKLIFALLLILIATPACAQLAPTPDNADYPGWIVFCRGMNQEIGRQAMLSDNGLMHAHAEQNINNLRDYFAFIFFKTDAVPTLNNMLYWEQRGQEAAGKHIWDAATVVDDTGDTRRMIIFARTTLVEECEKVSTMGATHHAEAQQIISELQHGTRQ